MKRIPVTPKGDEKSCGCARLTSNILISDISPDVLHRLERIARKHGCTVEQFVNLLTERVLMDDDFLSLCLKIIAVSPGLPGHVS